jgi:hypothetical protein
MSIKITAGLGGQVGQSTAQFFNNSLPQLGGSAPGITSSDISSISPRQSIFGTQSSPSRPENSSSQSQLMQGIQSGFSGDASGIRAHQPRDRQEAIQTLLSKWSADTAIGGLLRRLMQGNGSQSSGLQFASSRQPPSSSGPIPQQMNSVFQSTYSPMDPDRL